MRKLWPFVGIALAVAVGIAVAPYLGWLVALCAVAAALYWAGRIGLAHRERIVFALGVLIIGVLLYWPVWLLRQGDWPNAVAACVILLVLFFGRYIRAWLRPYWYKVFPD